MARGDVEVSRRLGNRILAAMPPQPWAEPLFREYAGREGLSRDSVAGGLREADLVYIRQAVVAGSEGWREGVLPEFDPGVAAEKLAARMGGEIDAALADAFRLRGWMAALGESEDTGRCLFLRWQNWRGVLRSRGVLSKRDYDSELEKMETLWVPVRREDFWARFQILGDAMRRGRAFGLPVFGESPSLRLHMYEEMVVEGGHSPVPAVRLIEQIRSE